jgi:hypothetical protein
MLNDDDDFMARACARTRPFERREVVLESTPTGRLVPSPSSSPVVVYLNSPGGRLEPSFGRMVKQLRAERLTVVMGTQAAGQSEAFAQFLALNQTDFQPLSEVVGSFERMGQAMQRASLRFQEMQARALDCPELTEVERRVHAPYFKPARVRGKAQWKQERR